MFRQRGLESRKPQKPTPNAFLQPKLRKSEILFFLKEHSERQEISSQKQAKNCSVWDLSGESYF